MSAPPSKGSDDRAFCPAASRDGRRCDFAEHPGFVHWSWVEGELQFWQALPDESESWRNQAADEDPLRDAPQALKGGKAAAMSRWLGVGQHHVLFVVDEASQLLDQARDTQEASETMQRLNNLIKWGRSLEVYNRPLVEATSIPDGQLIMGLLQVDDQGHTLVDRTPPDTGIPDPYAVDPASLREVLVPGHRGGCQGDCCRDGYSEETSYPECWTWEQVRTGVAERYRAWKDWAL